jgi:uncharacterized integral membrane protein
MQIHFVLSLLVAILVVIFAVTNAGAVPVKIFFAEYSLSLALVIFISAALGAVIATMFGLVKQFRLGKQLKKLHNENEALTAENSRLKDEQASKAVLQTPDVPTEES